MAELHLGKLRITPADSKVSFYAINNTAQERSILLKQLHAFSSTLPKGVKLTIAD